MKKIRSFLFHTYVFWAVFSFLNFKVLAHLVVPFSFLLTVPMAVEKFPSLMKPLVLAFVSGVFALMVAAIATRAWRSKFVVPIFLAYLFNGIFLMVFLVAADQQKNIAIASQLAHTDADCVHINSFVHSLVNAGEEFQFDEHALYKKDGRTFYWSYSTMSFFEGNERLDPNFPCR